MTLSNFYHLADLKSNYCIGKSAQVHKGANIRTFLEKKKDYAVKKAKCHHQKNYTFITAHTWAGDANEGNQ